MKSTELLRANDLDNLIEEDEDLAGVHTNGRHLTGVEEGTDNHEEIHKYNSDDDYIDSHTGVHTNGRLFIDLTGVEEGTDNHEAIHKYNSDDDCMDCGSIISISESEEATNSFEQGVKKRVLTDIENTTNKRPKNNNSNDMCPDLSTEESAVALEMKEDKLALEEGKVVSILRNAVNEDLQNLDQLDSNENCSAMIHGGYFYESSDDEDNKIESCSEDEESDEEADDIDKGTDYIDEETDDEMENEDDQIGVAVDEETNDDDEGPDKEIDEDKDEDDDSDDDNDNENNTEMEANESDETLREKDGPSASDRRSTRPPRPSKLALQAMGDSKPNKSAPSRYCCVLFVCF
jgi:hypothetical protein